MSKRQLKSIDIDFLRKQEYNFLSYNDSIFNLSINK